MSLFKWLNQDVVDYGENFGERRGLIGAAMFIFSPVPLGASIVLSDTYSWWWMSLEVVYVTVMFGLMWPPYRKKKT